MILRYTMQSLLSVFAVIYTALSLYACSGAADAEVHIPVADVPKEPERAIVNILQSRPEISQSLQEAVDMYAAVNPGAYLNVSTVPGNDYRVALRTRLLAGERCDVFHVLSGREARELAPYLADLSDLDWISSAAERTAEPLTFDGGVYGVPYSVECAGLIANRDIFAAAGILLSDIVTFADFSNAVEALGAMIAEGELTEDFPALKSVTDLAVQDKAWLSEFASDIVLSGGLSSFSDAGTVRELKLPHGAAAEEFFRLLARYSPKGDWTERDGLSYLSAQTEGFAAQKMALTLCDTAGFKRILELNPELEGRLALMPIPIPGQPESAVYTGAPLWWAVGEGSGEAAAESAKRFLTWLYRSESGSAVVAARFGVVSPWLDTGKETGKSLDNQMLALMKRGRTQPRMWREFPYDWGADIFAPEFRAWYTGERKWEEALAKMREGWAYGS